MSGDELRERLASALADLRREADNISGSGVVQRAKTQAGAKQLGHAQGLRRACNAIEKAIGERVAT